MSLLLLLLALPVPSFGVGAKVSSDCFFPTDLRDLWLDPNSNSTLSILTDTWATTGRCVLQLEGSPPRKVFVLRSISGTTCFSCLHLEPLHENVLRYRTSSCLVQRNAAKLCRLASTEKWKYLYRTSPYPSSCPEMLTGSHSFTYEEYSPTQIAYTSGCGEPRSESNRCHQNSPADPQLSINYGNCPSGTLVHRTSMTQTLRCLGSWQSQGTHYFVAQGEVWEYWQPGTYTTADKQIICMALQTDGLKLYLSQGFGSTCDGLGGRLSPRNGVRNLVMEKRIRLEQSCAFPQWAVTDWQLLPSHRPSLQPSPTNLLFPSRSLFQLATGKGQAQEFSCSKVLSQTETEVKAVVFSQARCLGEYHCVHLMLSAASSTISLHLGGATPHIEHACVAPAFDPDNPFLLATLLPLTQGGLSSEERGDHTFEPSENLGESGGDPFVLMPESERVVDVSTARAQDPLTLESESERSEELEREALARIHSYSNLFLRQVKAAVHELAARLSKQ